MKTHKPPHDPRLDLAMNKQDWPLLVRLCKHALRKNAKDLMAHRYLGFGFQRLRQGQLAIEAFAKALIYWPEDAELLLNYGQTLMEIGQDFTAIPFLEKAVQKRPDRFLTWLKLSQAHYRCQGHTRGLECAKKMHELAKLDTEKVNAMLHLALHEREFGKVKEAINHCQEALEINPQEISAHTNRLLFMLADPDVTAEHLRDAAMQYALAIEPVFSRLQLPHDASAHTPNQRLRLGLLSPDFRNHAVMYFTEGVLSQMDRRQFTVVALNLAGGEDAIAKRARAHSDEFMDLANRPFDEQLKLIQSSKLDILIDLAGHTGNNGLALMASKPAPVQCTWIGYPGTTGLKSIDYLITDEHTDPPGVENLYAEQLLRLNSRLCVYRPLIRNPLYRYQPAYAVNETPALINGFITFGSCNNLGKLTDGVLSTWAKILQRTPNAKLLIEGRNFEEPDTRSAYLKRCEGLGFNTEQLILLVQDARNQYLTYHQIDIALDPFPLNGGTTSMDVLWMGVPLVAMAGRSFRDRLTAGILLHLGRGEWLATNEDDYIEIACRLAGNISELNKNRLNLRTEVEQSILMREDRFCHRFGLSLRKVWLTWLATQRFPNNAAGREHQLDTWWHDLPKDWLAQHPPSVGLATGVRITLAEAQEKMESLLAKAKAVDGQPAANTNFSDYPNWLELTALCDTVLSAVANEPLALACLAEVEHAFGHTDFAVTYLRYAQTAIEQNMMSAHSA